jgi:ribosomal protein S18 acetylase RimI-like enzyme
VRSAKQPTVAHVGLVVIGVAPVFQGRGHGSVLIKEFEKQTQLRGLKKMVLTVKTDNEVAIRSYLRNGWITTSVSGNTTSMHKNI